MSAIELGDIAKDSITGFEGTVVCWSTWLNGCSRLTLQPRKMRLGKPVEPETFDELQLVLVAKGNLKALRETGGPRPEPVRAKDIRR
jgi:hypothetical protein